MSGAMASDGRHDKIGWARAALELLEIAMSPISWFFENVMTGNSVDDPVYKKMFND